MVKQTWDARKRYAFTDFRVTLPGEPQCRNIFIAIADHFANGLTASIRSASKRHRLLRRASAASELRQRGPVDAIK